MSSNVKMIRSIATFTLDTGKCPPWLFKRMVKLGRIILIKIVDYFGTEELLKRLADPAWFQSLGCVLYFDWNASGLTTTTLGALKFALKGLEKELGVFICGGKGRTSRKTPEEILYWSDLLGLSQKSYETYVKASKLTAKVDNSLIQDGFTLYHHNFIFTKNGSWVVIQQGMNQKISRARRYHWYSKNVKDFTLTPHSGIQSQVKLPKVFNLVLKEAQENKKGILELINSKKQLFYEIKRLQNIKLGVQLNLLNLSNQDFSYHPIQNTAELFENRRILKAIHKATENAPKDFDQLLLIKGLGPKTIRALSLVAEIIFGARPSFEDPIRYTYAFGGKDGIPYPVEKKRYDKTIEILEKAIKKSKLGVYEKDRALKRLYKSFSQML